MDPLDRLEQLIDQQERSVRAAFRAFLLAVGRDGAVLDSILAHLEARDTDGALKIVDSYVATMGNVLPAISHVVGAATAAELAELVPDVAIAISFDPTHPRAAEIIRENRLRFVRDFGTQQRKATMQALTRGYREGAGTAEIARAFRQSIGLTPYQEGYVASYRRALETQSRDALNRALRDTRFDPTVRRSVEGGKPLTSKQIDRMVDRYRTRALINRSETIARTEGGQATSLAREESLDQMIEQTGIAVDRIVRIWNTTRDKRTRDWHASMNGQKRGRAEAFIDGHGNRLRYPHDPAAAAETTINCRCGLTFSVRPLV